MTKKAASRKHTTLVDQARARQLARITAELSTAVKVARQAMATGLPVETINGEEHLTLPVLCDKADRALLAMETTPPKNLLSLGVLTSMIVGATQQAIIHHLGLAEIDADFSLRVDVRQFEGSAALGV